MKTIYILFVAILITTFASAQVAIGKDTPATDALLDFGDQGNLSIILPKLTTTTGAVPGTIYYNALTSKVEYIQDVNTPFDLSVKGVEPGNEFQLSYDGYNTYVENPNVNGVVLGANSSTAPGVLVLESTTKALVLPKVGIYSNVGDPEPGAIMYDEKCNCVGVYDGEK